MEIGLKRINELTSNSRLHRLKRNLRYKANLINLRHLELYILQAKETLKLL